MADPRDPDEIQYLKKLRSDLDELTATYISRWGRVPHVAADPASPPDGAVWTRSDLNQLRYRSNGVTYTAGLNNGVILTDAAQTFTTSVAADITWGTEVSDPDNWTSGGSATLTVPTGLSRRYIVTYNGTWSAVPGSSTVTAYINGVATYEYTTTGGITFNPFITFVRTFAAGDTIKFQAFQSSGVNRDLVSRLEIA